MELRLVRSTKEHGKRFPAPREHVNNPHDGPVLPDRQIKNYSSPNHSYCVETICAPCGVVVAWTKFAKSESPSNIMRFLESVYTTQDYQPAYICIDKACLVLKHVVANEELLGDRLCWVYDLPVQSYGELSIT